MDDYRRPVGLCWGLPSAGSPSGGLGRSFRRTSAVPFLTLRMNELVNSTATPPPNAPENHGLPALSPDTIEQERGEGIDNVVPTEGFSKLPVVGLGGSAGGLAALQAFFGAMPADSGMAFVVIMHLSPEHESILAEVLQRSTPMPVQQVRERTKVEPNQVYVIPPAKNLSMADGHLQLSDLARTRPGKHVAVDLFFRTLADTHGAHCAANRALGRGRGWGHRHQAHQGARRAHHCAGADRSRTGLHASVNDRHGHGRLGATRCRHSRPTMRLLEHGKAAAIAVRRRAAANVARSASTAVTCAPSGSMSLAAA